MKEVSTLTLSSWRTMEKVSVIMTKSLSYYLLKKNVYIYLVILTNNFTMRKRKIIN